MLRQVFSTKAVDRTEAVSYWLDYGTSTFSPHGAEVLDREDFLVQVQLAMVDDAGLSTLEMRTSCLERNAGHIRQGGGDTVYVVTPVFGDVLFGQHGRMIRARPGDIYLQDTRYPFELRFPSHASALGLEVPADWLTQRVGPIDRFGGDRVRAGTPLGAVAIQNLFALAKSETDLASAPEAWRHKEVALDLVAMALGQMSGDTPRLHAHADSARTRLVQVILRNVGNPDATQESIAREAAMSPRYARSLMAASGTTVMRRLQELRIERSKRLLDDPANRDRITDIAQQSIFSDHSHFTRVFREREGMTPREYRRMAQLRSGTSVPLDLGA